jgi:hypothetical protein
VNPHQWNINANGRRRERWKAKEGELVIAFKTPDNGQLLLVYLVGSLGPSIGHVNHSHALKTQKVNISTAVEFPTNDSTDGAKLADKSAPMPDSGKRQTSTRCQA